MYSGMLRVCHKLYSNDSFQHYIIECILFVFIPQTLPFFPPFPIFWTNVDMQKQMINKYWQRFRVYHFDFLHSLLQTLSILTPSISFDVLPHFMFTIFSKHLCARVNIDHSDIAILTGRSHLLTIYEYK